MIFSDVTLNLGQRGASITLVPLMHLITVAQAMISASADSIESNGNKSFQELFF
jgi:hypothetical protein